MNPEAAPDGEKALTGLPLGGPPARPRMASETGIPIGISYTPGYRTSPDKPTNFSPAVPSRPCDLNQPTPLASIWGTLAKVSTLLSAVGFCHNPTVAELGGLLRGSARLPSMASSWALPSPH